MAFCEKCGMKVEGSDKFCPSCGATMPTGEAQPQQQQAQATVTDKIQNLNNTADTTGNFDTKDIADNKLMAILSYLGILVLIPMFACKDSKFARYHANQGLVLFGVEVAYIIISAILRAVIKVPSYWYGVYVGTYTPGWLNTILWLISIPLAILAVLGIINAANGKAKELPVIGKFKVLK